MFSLKKNMAFSLIELIVAVSIMSILIVIGIPLYKGYIKQTNRKMVEELMLQDAQFLEQFYADHGSYIDNNSWPNLPYTQSPESGNIAYKINFASIAPNATMYVLVAQPKCDTLQAYEGCICMDRDGNITESAPLDCSNSGISCPCY